MFNMKIFSKIIYRVYLTRVSPACFAIIIHAHYNLTAIQLLSQHIILSRIEFSTSVSSNNQINIFI